MSAHIRAYTHATPWRWWSKIPEPRGAVVAASGALLVLPFSHVGALRNACLLLALLLAVRAWARLRVPRPPLLLPIGIWVGVALLSLPTALDRSYSTGEWWADAGQPLLVFLLFFAVSGKARLFEWWIGCLQAATLISLPPIVLWWAQSELGSTAWGFNGVGMYSTYLITVLPFLLLPALGLSSAGAAAGGASCAWIVVICALMAGALTGNRQFWVALGVEMVILGGLLGMRFPALRRRLLGAGVALLLIMAIGFALVLRQRSVDLDGKSISVHQSLTNDVRLQIWRYSLTRLTEHPLQGAGFGRGSLRQELRAQFGNAATYWHAHNLLLNQGLQMGLPGVMALLFLFGASAAWMWRAARAQGVLGAFALATSIMLLGVLVKNMTDDFFIRQNAILFWALLGMATGVGERARRSATEAAGHA